MTHYVMFIEPDFGTIEIEKPHGFNEFDLLSGHTTYLEVRNNGGEGFSKLLASVRSNGAAADAYYVFKEPCGNSVLFNICFSRLHTDGKTYFGMYVNDHSAFVDVKPYMINNKEQHMATPYYL